MAVRLYFTESWFYGMLFETQRDLIQSEPEENNA